ncbi:MAG: GAF domain-containing protein [Deltaproteobacteria bacterium]|nr:GAF domain-containing protein [Deltaproteobacteria bacterium]
MSFQDGLDISAIWQKELSTLSSASEVAAKIAGLTADLLKCEQVRVVFHAPYLSVDEFFLRAGTLRETSSVLSFENGRIECGGDLLYLPLFLSEIALRHVPAPLSKALAAHSVLSWGAVPILLFGKPCGWIECLYTARKRRWSRHDAEVLLQIGESAALFLEKFNTKPAGVDESSDVMSATQGLGGDSPLLVVMELQADGTISYASSKAEELTGSKAEELEGASIFDLLTDVACREAVRRLKGVLSGENKSTEFLLDLKLHNSKLDTQVLVLVESSGLQADRIMMIITDVVAGSLYRVKLDEAKLRSMRLMQYGNLIIIRTDQDLRITDILGDTDRIFGMSADSMLYDASIWERLLEPGDLRSLRRQLRQAGGGAQQISSEIRVRNRVSGETKWVLLNAIPRFEADGRFAGWEGFGLDVSDKHESESMLLTQRRRLEALYEISRSLQVNVDPALLALRGLRALIKATSATGGFAVFYDEESDFMEIVAAQGMSQSYLEAVSKVMMQHTLLRKAIGERRGMLIENVQNDRRAVVEIWRQEGLRSVIIMPLMYEDRNQELRVLGAILLAGRRTARFSEVDFELVQAASRQLALVIHQAEHFAAEKRQAGSLAALYRLSRELAKLISPREIGEHAFPIIQEELACKRIWFATLNEQGTHLVGQGGIGPGMRRGISNLQIALEDRHDFLDEALREKRAVVVEGGKQSDCSGLERLLGRLRVGTYLIVPLVSLGQVVGVLVAEPLSPSFFFAQRRLTLLSSMCNEMATVILARRFEAKMADADKMRMAGLLASGVAHNFNNLLQAVMGQASLIEVQLSKNEGDEMLVGAAHQIIESAAKGARLIKQMLTLTRQGSLAFRPTSIGDLLRDSSDLYRSLLGEKINFEVRIDENLPEVVADSGQIQQVIANLVVNAVEAISSDESLGEVKIIAQSLMLAPGEIDPELSSGPYVRIDVIDNGRGMDPKEIARCFEPFYTTKNVDFRTGIGLEGSGLGLSLSYSILKQHEGLLTAHSTKGEGSVFSVYLPAALAREDVAADADGKVAQGQESTQAVRALAWDTPENAELLLKGPLEALGIPLEVVSQEDELLHLIQYADTVAQILVVNLDLLPSLSAAQEVLQKVRSAWPQIEILGVSIEPRFWQRGLAAQVALRIADRPTVISALHAMVRDVFYRRNPAHLEARISVDRDQGQGKGVEAALGQPGDENEFNEKKI